MPAIFPSLNITDLAPPRRTKQCPQCRNRFNADEEFHPLFGSSTFGDQIEMGCAECAIRCGTLSCCKCNGLGIHDYISHLKPERNIVFSYAPMSGEDWESIPHIIFYGRCRHMTSRYICSKCAVSHSLHLCQHSRVMTDSTTIIPLERGRNQHLIWEHLRTHVALCEICYDHYLSDIHQDVGSTCSNCENLRIFDWSYKPQPVFFTTKKKYSTAPPRNTFFFGAEVELDVDKDYSPGVIARTMNHIPHVYVKSDSSINHGAEIVTHPMSFGAWKSFKEFYNALDDLRRTYDAEGFNNGIHVHISRKPFGGEDNEIKFRTFIHTLMSRYPKTFAELVMRSPNTYCHSMNAISNFRNRKDAVSVHQGRYGAINFCNRSTIELRSFRSSTSRKEIMSFIEFCDSAVAFSLGSSQDYLEGGPVLTPFYKFLKEHPRRYTCLIDRIKQEGIGGTASCVL